MEVLHDLNTGTDDGGIYQNKLVAQINDWSKNLDRMPPYLLGRYEIMRTKKYPLEKKEADGSTTKIEGADIIVGVQYYSPILDTEMNHRLIFYLERKNNSDAQGFLINDFLSMP